MWSSGAGGCRWALLSGALFLSLGTPDAGYAEEWTTGARLNWETGEGKSYLIPALEVGGFVVGLNAFNRAFIDSDTYGSDRNTIWRNLRTAPEFDTDPFGVNQIGHPYQGSFYYGFARSAGLSYWESLGDAPLHQRLRHDDHRRQLRGRGSLPDVQLAPRGRRRDARVLAGVGRRLALSAHRLQPSRLRRPVQGRFPEPQSGNLHSPAARPHPRHGIGHRGPLSQSSPARGKPRLPHDLWASREARVSVQAPVRLLPLRVHGGAQRKQRGQRHRELHGSRSPRRCEIRSGRRFPGGVGALRRLRVPVAADLPRRDHECRARHRRPVVADARDRPPGHGPPRRWLRRLRQRR